MEFDWNCAREFNAYEVVFIKKEENLSPYPNKQRERYRTDRASIENDSYTPR